MSVRGKGIGAFLIHSYLYYILHMSVIPDEEYDQLCAELADRWDTIEHRHKHLINLEDLKAGTGFAIREEQYPSPARHIAWTVWDWNRRGKDYLKWLEENSTGVIG